MTIPKKRPVVLKWSRRTLISPRSLVVVSSTYLKFGITCPHSDMTSFQLSIPIRTMYLIVVEKLYPCQTPASILKISKSSSSDSSFAVCIGWVDKVYEVFRYAQLRAYLLEFPLFSSYKSFRKSIKQMKSGISNSLVFFLICCIMRLFYSNSSSIDKTDLFRWNFR